MASRYRDTETGKFVSKEKWKRSKAHGGTRFKRERYTPSFKQKGIEEQTAEFVGIEQDPAPKEKVPTSIQEWEAEYDEAEEFYPEEEIEGGADY